jgi:hypothetical protein
MSLDFSQISVDQTGPLDHVEAVIEGLGWAVEREEDGALQAVAETRWGEMALLVAYRPDPAAVHVSLTLDIKPLPARRAAIAELILLANERLWLGHFDYWGEEGVILFRYTFPMSGRDEIGDSELHAVLAAAVSAADRFLPAFNFLIWAGKTPREAMEAALFETDGEA